MKEVVSGMVQVESRMEEVVRDGASGVTDGGSCVPGGIVVLTTYN